MPAPAEIDVLIAWVSELTGPDREVEWDLHEVLTGEVPDFHECPCYTASLDAVLALAERVLPEVGIDLSSGHGENSGQWLAMTTGNSFCLEAVANTPALALLLALLRALKAREA